MIHLSDSLVVGALEILRDVNLCAIPRESDVSRPPEVDILDSISALVAPLSDDRLANELLPDLSLEVLLIPQLSPDILDALEACRR